MFSAVIHRAKLLPMASTSSTGNNIAATGLEATQQLEMRTFPQNLCAFILPISMIRYAAEVKDGSYVDKMMEKTPAVTLRHADEMKTSELLLTQL